MELVINAETSMAQCLKCGEGNAPESQFCRFCGTRLPLRQPAANQDYGYKAPRPYSWKTDEYQTQAEARPVSPPLASSPDVRAYHDRQLAYRPPYNIGPNYRCPNCGTNVLPIFERRISTAGWVVFSALLVFTVIFFWIGLLMKENVAICPVCKARIN